MNILRRRDSLIRFIRIAENVVARAFKYLPSFAIKAVCEAILRLAQITKGAFSIAIIAGLLAVANFLIWFPGVPVDDSDSQYAQVVAQHINDWHPPIMARLWSIFRLVAEGNGPMFAFHVVCYWLGFGLVAAALGRSGRPLSAWGIIGGALLPPFVTLNVIILKDVGLAATFLAAFAALFWYRIQERKIPLAVVAISGVLLCYGTLVRANAVFAVVPLLAYMIHPRWLDRPWRLLVLSVPIALLMVPVFGFLNHSVLKATPVAPIRSLEIFDITGIAFYSGDISVFGPGNVPTRQDVDDCYTPLEWDTLSPWGRCRFFWDRLAVSKAVKEVEKLDPTAVIETQPNQALTDRWGVAIGEHPFAYVRHRLAHFSSEMFRARVGGADVATLSGHRRPLYRLLGDALEIPAFWLCLGSCLLVLLAAVMARRRSALIEAAVALDISGVTYSGAYLVVGVATDARYHLWSMIAIFVALVISLSEVTAPFASLPTASPRARPLLR